jgi:hypothetical protein
MAISRGKTRYVRSQPPEHWPVGASKLTKSRRRPKSRAMLSKNERRKHVLMNHDSLVILFLIIGLNVTFLDHSQNKLGGCGQGFAAGSVFA